MLQNLSNDLLDLAKEEHLTFQLNNSYFSMSNCINEAFETLKFISESRKIEKKLHVSSVDAKFFEQVYGDRFRFQQIFLNFISNSLKFSNQGTSVNVTLRVKNLKSAKLDKETGNLNSGELSDSAEETDLCVKFNQD